MFETSQRQIFYDFRRRSEICHRSKVFVVPTLTSVFLIAVN